jgi:hypothetical protein
VHCNRNVQHGLGSNLNNQNPSCANSNKNYQNDLGYNLNNQNASDNLLEKNIHSSSNAGTLDNPSNPNAQHNLSDNSHNSDLYNANNAKNINTGQGKTIEIEADYVIISTGSSARKLNPAHFSALDENMLWYARDAMMSKSIPNDLVVIGGGAIGLEFASFYNAIGKNAHKKDGFDIFNKKLNKIISMLENYIDSICASIECNQAIQDAKHDNFSNCTSNDFLTDASTHLNQATKHQDNAHHEQISGDISDTEIHVFATTPIETSTLSAGISFPSSKVTQLF